MTGEWYFVQERRPVESEDFHYGPPQWETVYETDSQSEADGVKEEYESLDPDIPFRVVPA